MHPLTDGRPRFNISTVAAQDGTITARHGLKVLPTSSFAAHSDAGLLIVPGGVVTQPLSDPRTLDWVRAASQKADITASVCTGAFILAKAGLLQGRRVTTHWEDIPDLRADYPLLQVVENVPYVDEGDVITSAGISAGIEMSLHLVSRLLGPAAATATAKQMQYTWSPAA